jgi:malate permease and related proteins
VSNFLTIFVALVAGFLCRRTKKFPTSSASTLNAFVIYISLPALIFEQIPTLLNHTHLGLEVLLPISMAWLLFALSYIVFSRLGAKLHWSRKSIGALTLTAGLANTSFVGFPLLEALIGPEALPIGILVDQPGSFLVVSTLGILVAASYSGRAVKSAEIAKRIVLFPPFLALVLAAIWSAVGTPAEGLLAPCFTKLASTLVPLALFAVGFQLEARHDVIRRRWRELAWGLGFKLAVAPIVFALFYLVVFQQAGLAARVTLLESAMAPMITSAVVAADFDLDIEIANLMVGVGIPLSLLSVPLVDVLLGWLI